MTHVYLLRMTSAEVHSITEVNDLIVFQDEYKAIAVKNILNKFLELNSSIIKGNAKEHNRLFYDNEESLTTLLSSYLDKEDASWLVREIGLNCYNDYMGISMNGFYVTKLKNVEVN